MGTCTAGFALVAFVTMVLLCELSFCAWPLMEFVSSDCERPGDYEGI